MKTLALLAITATLSAAAFGACSSSTDHDHDHADGGEHDHEHSEPPSCEAFHEACAALASTNQAAAECDELTHKEGITEAECAQKKDACLKTCSPAADGGADATKD